MKAPGSVHLSAGTSHKERADSHHLLGSSMRRQKQAHHGMLETAGVMERVLQQMPCGIMISDATGRTVLANSAAKQIAKVDSDEKALLSTILHTLRSVRGESIPVEECPWIKALRGESTPLKEYQVVQSHGRYRNVLLSADPITVDERIVGAVVVLIDITRQTHEEEALRKKSAKTERSQIAADLHDTLCQELTAIVLQLRAAEDGVRDGSAKAMRYLRRAQELAQDGLARTRDAIRTLSHEPLENEDLAQGLKYLAHDLFKALPAKLDLSLQNEPRTLAAETRVELLRIGREGLINVVKHAQATEVQIELVYSRQAGLHEVRLCIQDNGRGFVPGSSAGTHGHFGLIGMRNRAERLGGECTITSRPGQGTRITVQAPLRSSPGQGSKQLAVRESGKYDSGCDTIAPESDCSEAGLCGMGLL
jgi:signal transduction histidine kinase